MTLLLYAVESMEVSAGRALQILLGLFGMEKLELQLKWGWNRDSFLHPGYHTRLLSNTAVVASKSSKW